MRIFICPASVLLFATCVTVAATESQSNPYHAIADRNVFRLTTPREIRPPPPPPPAITLQGISVLPDRQQVCFKVVASLKPGEPPREVSLVLSVGERQGEIEVIEINARAATVRFCNHGEDQLLKLAK